MRIAYNNYIDDVSATALTAISENGIYPLINIQDQRLATQYRTTDVTGQSVIIDFGVAKTISVAAILNHTISGTTATILVEANSSDSWPGATSQTLIWNTNAILKFFAEQTYQYWKFSFEDADNTDGYLAMGRLWLGDYIDVSPSSLLSFNVIKKNNDNVIFGIGRQKYATPGVKWKQFELEFPESQYSMVNKIETMFDTVGNHTSLIFCNFDTVRDYEIVEPCYCSIVGELTFSHVRGMRFKYSLVLEENK